MEEVQHFIATALGGRAVGSMVVERGGEFESNQRSMQRLKLVVPVALLVTLVLLFNAFGSLLLASLVLLNVPFALIGGSIGLWVMDMPVSIAAAVSFIALVGQASLSGVRVLSAPCPKPSVPRRSAPLP